MSLTLSKCDQDIRKKIYQQTYPTKKTIAGVKLVKLKNIVLDDGDFNEIMHFNKNGAVKYFPNFSIAQINRTRLLPGSIKAWHLHFKQDEIWYLSPSDHLLVGLWDVRQKSKTKGLTMRLVMGGGHSNLLYIPKGVAHGSSVVNSKAAELYVFTNQDFNPKKPDERRISWNCLGENFWQAQKDVKEPLVKKYC